MPGNLFANSSENVGTEQNKDTSVHANTQSAEPNKSLETHSGEAKNPEEHESSNVFSHLLGELGDHHGLIIGPYHVAELPVILVDNGFHAYSSSHQMEEAGLFKMHSGHPVRFSDGKSPSLDLSITNLVCFQWIAILILLIAFRKAASSIKKNAGKAPKGILNLLEIFIIYIRDEIVMPNVGGKKIAYRLLPYFVGLFFFIIVMNLLGLIPGAHTATGSVGTTMGLAVIAFLVINFTSVREIGIGNWLKHLLGGAPWWLSFLMIPIEILSMFIKPFALTIRLFANMTAGHVVLLSLIGLIFFFKTILISPAIIGFSVFIYLLELLVAVIQAYIFTMLTAIFVGLAIGSHAHDEGHSPEIAH